MHAHKFRIYVHITQHINKDFGESITIIKKSLKGQSKHSNWFEISASVNEAHISIYVPIIHHRYWSQSFREWIEKCYWIQDLFSSLHNYIESQMPFSLIFICYSIGRFFTDYPFSLVCESLRRTRKGFNFLFVKIKPNLRVLKRQKTKKNHSRENHSVDWNTILILI